MSPHVRLALLCGTVCVLLSSGRVAGEDLTDATEILKKVDAATRAVKSVKYSITTEPRGAVKQRFPATESTVIASGKGEGLLAERFVVDLTAQVSGSTENPHYLIGADGENYYLIDFKMKKAYVDMDPNVIGARGMELYRNASMPEFVHPTPFSDELAGDKRELLGTKTISGEECYQIHVVYAGGRGEAVWCFSKKDFLPRQREDKFKMGTEDASFLRTVSRLEIAPTLDDDAFKLKVPEGFEKTDEFAP